MKLISILADMETSKYCRIWGTENPHAYIEKPMHPKQVTENEQREAVTVNGDRYRAMLNEVLFGNIWFQQDVVTCHTCCF